MVSVARQVQSPPKIRLTRDGRRRPATTTAGSQQRPSTGDLLCLREKVVDSEQWLVVNNRALRK